MLDPRVERAIEFHHRRALRLRVLRGVAFAGLIAVIVFVPSWYVRVPTGIIVGLSTLFIVVDLFLVRSHRVVAKAIEADMTKVVWVHYFTGPDKICPLFLYDERMDFAPLRLPGGYARPLIDAFRALEKPPLITTDDDERRIVEPRQKFLAKLLEVEALTPSGAATFAKLRTRFGSTLDGAGRDAVVEKLDRLAASPPSDEVAKILAELEAD